MGLTFRSFSVVAWLFLSVSARADFDLKPVVGPAGPDVTREFRAVFDGRDVVSAESLRTFRILFIPGFNADYLDDTVGYFREARRELRRLGLREGEDFELLMHQSGFSGERTMDENAAALARILRASPRPVLAVTHSKGAVDLLETLLVYKDTRAKVKGWFSYQGANGGSILADVVSRGWARPFADAFLRGYGGSIEALEDLQQPVRRAYLSKNLPGIEALLREVPVVSLVTQQSFDRLSLGLRTLVTWFDPEYRESQSDGMIAIPNAFLPYSPFVFLPGVSHENTTQNGPFDRVRLTQASLRMLLNRIAPKP